MLLSLPVPNDKAATRLVLAPRLVAERRLAPGRLRTGVADGRLAFATTVGVVARGHRRSSDGRSPAQAALAAGLAIVDILVLDVAHLADRCVAPDTHPALLTRGQAQQHHLRVARHDLRARAGTAHHLTAPPGNQLDVMNRRAGRNIHERQRAARPNLRLRPGGDRLADRDADRRQDIALLAVRVLQQSDPGRPIRVVL